MREAQVYCEIHPHDIDEKTIRDFQPKGTILSGSPESVYDNIHCRAPECVFDLGVPVLWICYLVTQVKPVRLTKPNRFKNYACKNFS